MIGTNKSLGGSDIDAEQVTIVDLAGEIDAHGMKQVIARLNSAVKRGTGAVIVSFERVQVFESGLLRELVRVGQALAICDRRLLIAMPRTHPGRLIFHVLNLERMFECFESQGQALNSAPAGAGWAKRKIPA